MDPETLRRLEVVERIAFERGRQKALADPQSSIGSFIDVFDLTPEDDEMQAAAARAAERGHAYGLRQGEFEFEFDDDEEED